MDQQHMNPKKQEKTKQYGKNEYDHGIANLYRGKGEVNFHRGRIKIVPASGHKKESARLHSTCRPYPPKEEIKLNLTLPVSAWSTSLSQVGKGSTSVRFPPHKAI
jgi:hypothetical protein